MRKVQNLGQKREAAKAAFVAGDYDAAVAAYESIILSRETDFGALFGLAHIYEYGLSSAGVKLEKALNYYARVVPADNRAGESSGAASLAVARVIYKIGDRSRANDAVIFCEESIAIRDNPEARILLGIICENWIGDSVEARKNFLRAHQMKAPYALRLYARSLMHSKKYILGCVAYAAATILWPCHLLLQILQVMPRVGHGISSRDN